MGWASAGRIFDPIAKTMAELNAPDDMKIKVLGDLIAALQEGDWDTEHESLDLFAGDPAIVEAFRRNNVILGCRSRSPGGEWCELERGHSNSFHKDWKGHQWPKEHSGG